MSRAARLRALERLLPAAGEPGSITMAEWVQWRTTGEQPERWLKSHAIQAQVVEIMGKVQASLVTIQAYEDELIQAYEDSLREFEDYE